MAHLRKRKGKWRVEIFKYGFPRMSKTFISKTYARNWAKEIELKMDKDIYEDCLSISSIKLKDLLIKYRDEIVINHKAKRTTTHRMNILIKNKISDCYISKLKSADIYSFKNELKQTKAPKTVNIYIQLLKSVWNTAKKIWSIPMPSSNPLDFIVLEKVKNIRDVVLTKSEYKTLLDNAERSKLNYLKDLIQVAYQTAARFSEIVNLQRINTDFGKRLATFKDTKNGEDRTIPLSNDTIRILKKYPFGEKFFNVRIDQFTFYWRQCRRKSDLNHFRFHDLRACAITNMLLSGMSIAEVASISGHKTWSQLQRYTRIKPENLVGKINNV